MKAGTIEAACLPEGLTASVAKARHFVREPYTQEVLHEIYEICRTFPIGALQNRSFLIFKPDAAPVRCVERTLDALAGRNIRPVAAELLRFDRLSFRELWRYELNISTYARYAAVDALLMHGPSLFVLLDGAPITESNLACELARWKGPSEKARRGAEHLRTIIDARDGLLNHIHCPDEPADILREIGILFDRKARSRFYPALTAGISEPLDVSDSVSAFYRDVPRHELLAESVLDDFGRRNKALDPAALAERARTAVDLQTFRAELRSLGLRHDFWDAMTLFADRRICAIDHGIPVLELEDDNEDER